MRLIDTHAHLYLDAFDVDRSDAVARAKQAGVEKILLPNIDLLSVEPMLLFRQEHPGMFEIMTGLHPTSVKENWKEELDTITASLSDQRPVAVGETGVDLYWDKTYIAEQKEAFVCQIEYAAAHDLPLVIHSRNSLDLILEILKPYRGKVTGVFHCFPGSVQQAKKCVELGFMLGMGGVVTYKNSKMADVAAYLPLETIVLETDAPFLTPQDLRGKRNESAHLIMIADFIAERRNITSEDLALATTQNAIRLFKL